MNYSNYRFTLDTQSNISQVSLPVRLLDTSRRLYISLTDGGSPYIIEDGCRAVFYARKADGKPIMNDCIIEKNTQIRYDLTQQTTACAGVVDCEVRLYGMDGKLITSPRFIMVVDERVVYDEDFPLSEAEQTVLDNIILSETARANAEELRVAAEELRVSAESERSKIHEEMNASIKDAKEISDALEQKIAEGDYKGDKGDPGDIGPTGNSGVHIGSEAPTDPEVNVWVNPTAKEESHVLRVKDKDGNWASIKTIQGETPYIKYATWWIGGIDTGIRAEAQESAMMATGSYVGTGTSGANNPTILTFDFEPKFLIITHNSSGVIDPFLGIFIKGRPHGIVFIDGESVSGFGDYYSTMWGAMSFSSVTFSDNSVSIIHDEAGRQFNEGSRTYHYVAIGNGAYNDGDEVEY